MDIINRFIELKRNRLAEIAEQMTRLRGEIEVLGREGAKLRTQIETAEDMRREVTEATGAEAPDVVTEAPAAPVAAPAALAASDTPADVPEVTEKNPEGLPATPEAASSLDTGSTIKRRPRAGVSLIDAIRQIVRDLPTSFSTGAVREQVQARYPELTAQSHFASISGTMRRMAMKGELIQEQLGGPGREATYRLPEAPPPLDVQAGGSSTLFEGEQ